MGNHGTDNHDTWIRTALATYEERLLRYAQRILGPRGRAEDVVQETFLKLCQEDRSQLNGRLAQWLYTVCRNQAFDVLRKEARMAVLMEDRRRDEQSAGGEHASPQHSAEETARVLQALSRLTQRQQQCVRLKFEEGHSYRQISEATGMSVSNVGFTIHVALKRMRELLKDSGD